ncbi:ANTAR domain-containing protein [Catenulispora sp. GAS73]|uniref:ANTAR domain-containing protein n=1 Tax=Catenulispora sp. GAS73 TaxID=3156269 RepID=UPI00351653FD
MTTVLAMLDRNSDQLLADDRATAEAAARALGVDGITAGVGSGPSGTVLAWGSGAVSAEVDHLQFTLGQGPGTDCAASGLPVLAPDLTASGARWPAFAPAAAALGVRAVFAFPLNIGAMSVGTMLAYRGAEGSLSDKQYTDAVGLAIAVTVVLIGRRSVRDGGPDNWVPAGWAAPQTYRAEVHQATGMISVQLGVSLAEALARLRAYAYSRDRLIAEVAADVVARRLRFDGL